MQKHLFLKLCLVGCAALCRMATGAGAPDADASEIVSVRPSQAHLEYHEREIIALVCWGLNPYTGQEWGFGNVPPSKITAKRLDPAQWARAMKAAEISCVVLVAKHHDGFSLWPSKLNGDYSMSAVPAPNTGRDLVRELADACRERGMKFGVYLSPWDRHQGSYATPAYVDYFFAQWNELLDNYGEISEIWITFADPQERKPRKRLTHPRFLESYRRILVPDGIIHLKTDSRLLHHFTRETVLQNGLPLIEACEDIYGTGRADDLLSIQTFYEKNFLAQGIPITYLSFRLGGDKPLVEPEWDQEPYEQTYKTLTRS